MRLSSIKSITKQSEYILKYIELKTDFQHDGPACIGEVTFSKSGRTIYFNGKSLKSSRSRGETVSYHNVEIVDEYWISDLKKDDIDRLGWKKES